MANRHSHKKLRAEIRVRMARTGERYQIARARILERRGTDCPAVDLVPFRFFGVPMTLMTADSSIVTSVAVLGGTSLLSASYRLPLTAWLWPRGTN